MCNCTLFTNENAMCQRILMDVNSHSLAWRRDRISREYFIFISEPCQDHRSIPGGETTWSSSGVDRFCSLLSL